MADGLSQSGMRFRVLGPLEVWACGGWAGVPAAKQRALLAALLLRDNQVVAAGWLVEQLWGGRPPAGAANQLQVYVSRLRRRLGDPGGRVLVTRAPGYRLEVGAGELDVLCFEELVAGGRRAAREGALDKAAGLFAESLGLWRGPALADVPAGGLLAGEAARLEERRLGTLEDRIEVELGLGRHRELVGELQQLVAEQPLRERLWGQLLVALYRSGRQAEALAAYQRLRRKLVEELGIAPSPPLQRLQRQILKADPELEQPVPAADPAVGAAAVRRVPVRQLPADIAEFTGRGRELAWLAALLLTADRGAVVICAINGAGGVGKSALAIHAAHQLSSRFPDGQLYVNLQGATPGLAPLAPLEVAGRLLRTLGLEPPAVPGGLPEASGLLRSLLAGRRMLMVLDNALDAAQVRWLLPASPTCGALVTSRRALGTLEGARHLALDVLPRAEAVALLGRQAGHGRIAAEP
ncbi:MAG TPA: AfsR/SARP family transcriptional regulator, partial [Streptosporangiaceae bacterium]